ncbi:MAG: hypothetical protein LBJ43_02955 [Propionibacteriaceae bacterium]|nr:hypothetical protein [Propionibacteriaceae bacterium]
MVASSNGVLDAAARCSTRTISRISKIPVSLSTSTLASYKTELPPEYVANRVSSSRNAKCGAFCSAENTSGGNPGSF